MFTFNDLNRAYGEPECYGIIKSDTQDFRVDEIMPITPTGEGEHLWLWVEKTGCNTDWLARQLAQFAQVKPMAVSYAGLKDRHGVTRQWFSIHLPGQPDPDLSRFKLEGVEVLQHSRHERKLKRGALSGNCFTLVLRDIVGDRDKLEQRLQRVAMEGVPNYFGAQRFGHDMGNLDKAEQLFRGELKRPKRHQKSLYLSAARSWMFNRVLSERIAQGNWNRYMSGDVLMLEGKNACFADDGSEALASRVDNRELHPTGPLWGKGQNMAQGNCAALEQSVIDQMPAFARGLEQAGMKQERRALRLLPDRFSWCWLDDTSLQLNFCLPAGTFATILVRELLNQPE